MLPRPSAIEGVVRSFPELSYEFEVIEAKKGDVDDITLKVELVPWAVGEREEVEARPVDRLRLKTNLRYALEFHEHSTLPSVLRTPPEGKGDGTRVSEAF